MRKRNNHMVSLFTSIFSVFRSLLFCMFILVTGGCNDENHGNEQLAADHPVILQAELAEKEGNVQKKWGRWVVWCGHKICSGSYTWTFPKSGTFTFVWKDVNHKCAGSSPYAFYINEKKVVSGRIPQHGSCDGCTPNNIKQHPQMTQHQADINFGQYIVRKGDRIKLWVQNDFACGIEGPGAYGGYFLEMIAYP